MNFDIEIITTWLTHYGSIVLFLLLVCGIIILPVPEETLMVLAGVLMSKGILNILPTILAAYAGSITGITISYTLGRKVGHYLIVRYGNWVGATEKRLHRVRNWFKKYGKWTLLFGYFIPGVRHFTGFLSGMGRMNFKQFMLFAYSGAILWVTTFLSIGYFCGNYCFSIFKKLDRIDIDTILTGFLLILIIYIFYRLLKNSNPYR